MADGLRELTTRLTAALRTGADAARRHGFWVALPVATLAVAGVAAVIGSTAVLRAEAWQVRSGELRATAAAAAMWRQELVPVTDAERSAWRSSEAAVRERGIDPADRLALLQRVAQRAEDLGIPDVSVAFVSSDTLTVTTVREVGEEVFEVAPWALSVRFVADYETAATFIGSLPPQVDVHRVRLTALDDGLETDLILILFAGGS